MENEKVTLEQLTAQLKTAVEKLKASEDKSEATENAIKAINDQLTALKDLDKSADITKIYDKLNSLEGKMFDGMNGTGISFKSELENAIKEKHEEIVNLKKAGAGKIELKVAETVTTANTTVPDGIPVRQGTQVAPPSNVNLASSFIDELVSVENTSMASLAYTETLPKDGDYKFLAEAEVKPQIDFTIETRYASPVKAAAWIKLTDEVVQDVPRIQSIATDFLRKKHDLKRQKGILFGTGTNNEPKGATLYARAFNATKFANHKVEKADFLTLVNAGITDIYTTHNYEDEMPYMPNLVLINPLDFFSLVVSARTTDGIALYPTASLFNQVVIGGVTIKPYDGIPAGKILIADMSKYNVTNYIPYSVSIGWVNDDFIKNQFVVLGESRFHAYVKKLDEQAFIYDDISNIKDAILADNSGN